MADPGDRNDRTLYVGNIDRNCKEELLYELFVQAGPLDGVTIAKERDGTPKSFGFIEFKHDVSVPYALNLLNGTALFGRELNLKFRNGSKHMSLQYRGPPAQVFPKGFSVPMSNQSPPAIHRSVSSPAFGNMDIARQQVNDYIRMQRSGLPIMEMSQLLRGMPPNLQQGLIPRNNSSTGQGSRANFDIVYDDDSRPSSAGSYQGSPNPYQDANNESRSRHHRPPDQSTREEQSSSSEDRRHHSRGSHDRREPRSHHRDHGYGGGGRDRSREDYNRTGRHGHRRDSYR